MRSSDTLLLSEAYSQIEKEAKWNHWLSQYNFTKNADGTIDIDGDVYFSEEAVGRFPFKFGKVTGDFHCDDCGLVSLEGAPHTVHGCFDCSNNDMETLVGGPKIVEGQFACSGNYDLSCLEGAPHIVGGDFYCANCNMSSLYGAPKIVKGDFDCSYNDLESLEYAPDIIEGQFNCSRNEPLISLKGLPKAKSYKVEPEFTQADVVRELERQDLDKHMSPTAKEAWGTDVFADL